MKNSDMSEPNYAENIIVNLASLPDFLRKPILTKRLGEFFKMSEPEQKEIINNALAAGPEIPFPNFSKLCKTWLEVLSTFDENQRAAIFSRYIEEIIQHPEKIIAFNLDGILGILISMEGTQQKIIGNTIKGIVLNLDESKKELMLKLIPNNAKKIIGV